MHVYYIFLVSRELSASTNFIVSGSFESEKSWLSDFSSFPPSSSDGSSVLSKNKLGTAEVRINAL